MANMCDNNSNLLIQETKLKMVAGCVIVFASIITELKRPNIQIHGLH